MKPEQLNKLCILQGDLLDLYFKDEQLRDALNQVDVNKKRLRSEIHALLEQAKKESEGEKA